MEHIAATDLGSVVGGGHSPREQGRLSHSQIDRLG